MSRLRPPDPQVCKRCGQYTPWISIAGNLAGAIYKMIVGFLGSSSALMADAMQSFANTIGSVGVLVSCKIAGRPPDAGHPYGHGKAEFIGAIFVYTLMSVFAAAIITSSVLMMVHSTPHAPHFVTLLGAVVSIIYNLLMYQYSTCAGIRTNSAALLAAAFENRADVNSSIAVVIGIIGAWIIHPMCDAVAALIVGLIIAKACVTELRHAAAGLMDPGLPEQDIDEIKGLTRSNDEVIAVEFVRTRRTGPRYRVDLGIQLSRELNVGQSDTVAGKIRSAVLQRNPQIEFVEVYVAPATVAG